MTKFFLIRHGANDFVGNTIAGRMPGVRLNAEGRSQAERLAEKLSRERIDAIFSSPLERTVETAEPLAKELGLELQITDALLEIDFGDWTRKTLDELAPMPLWQKWNSFRSATRIPNGEIIVEVQARMVGQIEKLRRQFPEGNLAIFSHGDPIRSVLTHFLGMPLDLLSRIEVSPASVSTLALDDFGPHLLGLNDVV